MNRRSARDHLADGEGTVRGLAAHFLQHAHRHGHVSGAAHQEQTINLVPAHVGLAEHLLRRQPSARKKIARERFKFLPGQWHGENVSGMRAGDAGLAKLAQSALGALRGRAQVRERQGIGPRVVTIALLKLGRDVIDDPVVPVLAAKTDVALDCDGLEAALRESHEGHVERAAAQVVYQDGLLPVRKGHPRPNVPRPGASLKGVGQGGSSRLVENVQNLQPGDPSGVLGRLTASVVEVGRDGDHGLANRTQALFGIADQLAQDDGRERLGAKSAPIDLRGKRGIAHAPLDERGYRIGPLQRHIARRRADDRGVAVDQDGARRQHLSVRVRQRDRLPSIIEGRDGAESRSEIDAYQFAWTWGHVF